MYIFVDIETTGLDPKKDKILEVGIALVRGSFPNFESVSYRNWVLSHPPEVIDLMDKKVREMHSKSELIVDLAEKYITEAPNNGAIEQEIVDVIKEFSDSKLPMCGSSVHFDREFLKAHMPKVEESFHYRNIDVSSLQELFKTINPKLAADGIKHKLNTHRAIPDLKDTIIELQVYTTYIQGDKS